MTFSEHLETAFFSVLRLSFTASLLIVTVLILQWIFRKQFSPKWHYLLWMIVVLRLAFPWSVETSLSPFNLLPQASPVFNSVTLSPASVTHQGTQARSTSPTATESVPQPLHRTWTENRTRTVTIIASIWIAGVIVFASRVTWRYLSFAKKIAVGREIDDSEILETLNVCRQTLHVRKWVRILDVPGYNGIALYGIRRPFIITSRTVLSSLSKDELQHICLHELAHLKQRDIAMSWLCTALQALHWFNPVIWYGFHRMRLDRETATDYRIVQRANSGVAYGHTLLNVFEKIHVHKTMPGALGIVENRSFLKRRIDMIAHYTTRPYRYPLVGFVIALLLGGIFLSGAQSQSQETELGSVYPYEIPFEMYQESWSRFQPGDSIIITEFRGTSPRIEVGASYRVTGSYTLASQSTAKIHAYATSGEVQSTQGPDVSRGSGIFVREFTLTKMGDLHVDFYPANGGQGFGGMYYRKKTTNPIASDQTIDLAISDSDLSIVEYKDTGMYQLIVAITNKGTEVTKDFDIHFYQNDPNEANPMTHGGHGLHPDAIWREGSMPFLLKEGENHVVVKIDPKNRITETDETNNVAEMKVQTKPVEKIVHRIE